MRALHPGQHGIDFTAPQHLRQTRRTLGPNHLVEPGQVHFKDFPLQNQQCRQGLILRRRSNFARHGQIRQKRLHLRRPHAHEISFVIK